jgi:hypothetical protein
MNEIWEKYPGRDSMMRGRKGGSGGSGGSGDNEEPTSEIARLQVEYDQAIASRDTKNAIRLKNRIFTLRKQEQGRGRAA